MTLTGEGSEWVKEIFSIGSYPPILLGILGGLITLACLAAILERLQFKLYLNSWRSRLGCRRCLDDKPGLGARFSTLVAQADCFLNQAVGKHPLSIVITWWREAGLGSSSLSFLGAAAGLLASGSWICYWLTGSTLLSGFAAAALLAMLVAFSYFRAIRNGRKFQDQLPNILDRLADSLQVGFSLSQAIRFIIPNLAAPGGDEMSAVARDLDLGFSLEQALDGLYSRRKTEDVRLLVAGLTLQHQVGGNLPAMMRKMSVLLRERTELANTVRTLTSQGRLTAVVIALLVPFSVGLLSLFPGYLEVLFESTIGNLVLIAAGLLEIMGGMLVMRVIKVEY